MTVESLAHPRRDLCIPGIPDTTSTPSLESDLAVA